MGIRGKLAVCTVALAALIAAGPICLSMVEQRRALTRELETRAQIEARHLARQLEGLAVTLQTINDGASLRDAIREEDVIAAYALDREGWLVSDGTEREYRNDRRLPEFEAVRELVTKTREVAVQTEGALLHASAPIMVRDEVFGYAHVVLSLNRVAGISDGLTFNQFTLLGGLLLIGGLLAWMVANTLCRPLQEMLDGANALKSGNFKVRIAVHTRDEMGKLATSINEMAAGLRATTVSKRYLDEVIQSMVDSLIVVDTDANIVTVNRATVDLLGYPEAHLVGQPASLVCIDEGYQLTGARLHHLLGSGSQRDHELMYRTADGELIPMSFSGSEIRDNSGDVVGYVCIGKDITDRKRAEAERERLNQRLVDTSRQAGMAEVATGVLHNVGNVLNSVNMSASLVADAVKRSKVSGLGKAVELLEQNAADLAGFMASDKGQRIPAYLGQLSRHLVEEQSDMLGELESLTRNINHIKEIISMQQSYSKVTGVVELVDLAELIDEALRMNDMSLQRHEVTVERDLAEVPPLRTDKHKILQILVNLITNAKDAVDKADGDRCIRLRMWPDRNASMLRIEVIDNGEGISKENLTSIFKHGFTTKKKGHGFGLHSAALTASELKGSLVARSDGPGTGASFVLSLPMEAVEVTS